MRGQRTIGGLKVSDDTYKPAKPTGLTVDYAYSDGQMIVSWDLPENNYGNVVQYNLYGTLSDGRRVYLGGTYDSILYVKSMFDESKIVDLELCAVGKDGTESDPATYSYTYENKVSNVTVKEATTPSGLLVRAANPGKLEVSFDAPKTGKPDSYMFEVTLRNIAANNPDNKVYTVTADGAATKAEISLPVKEGYEYDLKIYAITDGEKGEPICYRGWSNDSYSEPIARKDLRVTGLTVRLVDPDSVDWYKMYVTFDGGEEKSIWLDNEDIIYSFVTNDGAIYGVKTFDKGTSSLNIIADINGAKNPNRGAKDLCLYYVSNGGTVKESCAQMAKVETAETDACVVPDDYWDNCQPGFKWLEIKYKHVCAKCKSGYKMVKLPGKLVAGYCMPQGCK